MNALNLPDATIGFDDGVGGKYIVITTGSDTDRLIFWAQNQTLGFHKDVVTELEHKIPEFCVIGGGSVWIDRKMRQITIWDWSSDYGGDDKVSTAELLERAFSGFTVYIGSDRKVRVEEPLPLSVYRTYKHQYLEQKRRIDELLASRES